MDRLQFSAWQYVAEILPAEELPMLAAHALVDGRDSPALRELAGLPRRSNPAEPCANSAYPFPTRRQLADVSW
jgi:hypothetical protein